MSVTWVLVFVLHCYCVYGQRGFETGNVFINGNITLPNDKITAGYFCFHNGTMNPPDVVTVVLAVFENDDTFVYNDPDGTAGDQLVKYECRIVSATGNIEDVTTDCPAGNSSFIRQETTMPVGTDAIAMSKYRTQTITLDDIDVSTDGPVDCGGVVGGNTVTYRAMCKREFDFDSWSDLIITFQIDHSLCVANITEFGAISVANPSNTDLTRRYTITFDMYKANNASIDAINDEFNTAEVSKSDDANKVGPAGVPLGQALYLEACIEIPDTDSRLYFIDGASVLGLRVTNCIATPDGTIGTDFLSTVPESVQISNPAGCGLGVSPAKQWDTNKYVFKYGRGGTIAMEKFRESPNCFRSEVFEAVSFARLDPTQTSGIIFTCDVAYCFNSTEPECFGTENGGPDDYPTCPSTGRRRRDTYDVEIDDLPRSVSISLKIQNDVENTETSTSPSDDCFDKSTFIALVSVLVGVMVMFVCADIGMVVQLKKVDRRLSPFKSHSSSSDTSSSFLSSRH